MPAGSEQQDPSVPKWTDYPSFRRFVIAECLRLGQPAPDDTTLGNAYIDRVVTLRRLDAVDEVATWNTRHGGRRGVRTP